MDRMELGIATTQTHPNTGGAGGNKHKECWGKCFYRHWRNYKLYPFCYLSCYLIAFGVESTGVTECPVCPSTFN